MVSRYSPLSAQHYHQHPRKNNNYYTFKFKLWTKLASTSVLSDRKLECEKKKWNAKNILLSARHFERGKLWRMMKHWTDEWNHDGKWCYNWHSFFFLLLSFNQPFYICLLTLLVTIEVKKTMDTKRPLSNWIIKRFTFTFELYKWEW